MNQQEESNDDDDFKKYIDKVLDGNGQDSEMQCEQDEQEAVHNDSDTSIDSTTFVADPLMTKSTPDAVHSHVQIPQSTASAVVVSYHEDEEYDEEAGDFASSTPLTTAVAVDDAPVARKRFSRRFKIFVAAAILMVLVGFIIWPAVVFMDEKNEQSSLPSPARPEGFAGGGRGGSGSGRGWSGRDGDSWSESVPPEGDSGSDTDAPEGDSSSDIVSSTPEGDIEHNVFGDSSDADGNKSYYFDRTEDTGRIGPNAKSIQGDSLTMSWQGGSYECVVVPPS